MGMHATTISSSQKVPRPQLSHRQEKAARLLAEGNLIQSKIADEINVTRRTLSRWITDPSFAAFQTRLVEYRQRYAQQVLSSGLARREKRVQKLSNLHRRLEAVINERAADPTMANVPGGKTGVVVRTLKSLEVHEDVRDANGQVVGKRLVKKVIPEYRTDTATTAELRHLQEQIAVECGDRFEEQSGPQTLTAIAITVHYEQPQQVIKEPSIDVEAEAVDIAGPTITIERAAPRNGDAGYDG